MKYEQHELSAAFPRMSDEQFKALVDDIDENGLREPIVVYKKKIIDGWHRYSACMELNVKSLKMVEYEGVDPAGYVLSKNLHRRHMDVSQRAFAVAKCVNWQEGAGRPSKSVDSAKESIQMNRLTLPQAAELAQVGESTMQRAKAATQAIDEVQDLVAKGKMKVSEAAALAALPEEEQQQEVDKRKAGGNKNSPKSPKSPKRELVTMDDYLALKEEYDDLASNYQVMATELSACEAIRNGDGVKELKKLHSQINTLIVARDQWQNKAAELTRQLNWATNKLKKYEKN